MSSQNKFTEKEVEQFEDEVVVGRSATKAYEQFILPFINGKRLQIHEAFEKISMDDEQMFKNLKMTLKLLEGLEADLKTYIETGKMSEIQLSSIEKEVH